MKEIKEKIVDFNTALLAFQCDFCVGSAYYYKIDTQELIDNEHSIYINGLADNCIEAPTQSILQRWLREEKLVDLNMNFLRLENNKRYYIGTVNFVDYNNNKVYIKRCFDDPIDDYDKIVLKGLNIGLNLIFENIDK